MKNAGRYVVFAGGLAVLEVDGEPADDADEVEALLPAESAFAAAL